MMYIRRTIPLRSIWDVDKWNMIAFALYATMICILHRVLAVDAVAIPFLAVGTLGTAVAIMLAFKNNTAYSRWWTAREAWGGLLVASRQLAALTTPACKYPTSCEGSILNVGG